MVEISWKLSIYEQKYGIVKGIIALFWGLTGYFKKNEWVSKKKNQF